MVSASFENKIKVENSSSNRKAKIIGIVVIVLSIILSAYTKNHKYIGKVCSNSFIFISTPILEAINYVASYPKHLAQLTSSAKLKSNTIDNLKREVAALRTAISFYHDIEDENIRLRRLLGDVSQNGLQGILADVIGRDFNSWSRGIVLDKGTEDGVQTGLPVIGSYGIIGQTTSVSKYSSKVMLITDPQSGIDVFVEARKVRGILKGKGSELLKLEFASEYEGIISGDLLVTSGFDGVFPAGIKVGKVNNVGRVVGLFPEISIKPVEELPKIREAYIVKTLSFR